MNLIILTDFHSFTVNEEKNQNYSIWRFLLRSMDAFWVKIWKWLKLLNSVPFIKKTLVNHLYIRISSFWLTFTALQWMKTNFKISQFSIFLLTSKYAIQVKIWKWLKLLNSVLFIKKTLVNHLLRSMYVICVKILKMIKRSLFSSIHQENICKSCLHSNLILLTDFHSFTVNEGNLQN